MDNESHADALLTPLQCSLLHTSASRHPSNQKSQRTDTLLIRDQLKRLQRTARYASTLTVDPTGSRKAIRRVESVHRVDRLMSTLRGRSGDFRGVLRDNSPKESASQTMYPHSRGCKALLSPSVVQLGSLCYALPSISPTSTVKRKFTFEKLPFRWSRVTLESFKEQYPRRLRRTRNASMIGKERDSDIGGPTAQSIRNLGSIRSVFIPLRRKAVTEIK